MTCQPLCVNINVGVDGIKFTCTPLSGLEAWGREGRFGADVMTTALDFVQSLVEADPILDISGPVLDVGTGNGVFPVHLRRRGFYHVTGSDYCPAAVDLCREVAASLGVDDICFVVDDILQTSLPDR